MNSISFSEFRKQMKSIMDGVADDHEALIITRQRGLDMVILSLEDYQSMEETCYLMSSPNNIKELKKIKAAQAKHPKISKREDSR